MSAGLDGRIVRQEINARQRSVFICILKFDFFFFISFSLQFVLLVLDQSQLEVSTILDSLLARELIKSAMQRYLTLIAVPVSLLLLYTAFWTVRREARWSLYGVLVACVGAALFFAFKLYRMYKEKDGAYRLVYKSLTVFCE